MQPGRLSSDEVLGKVLGCWARRDCTALGLMNVDKTSARRWQAAGVSASRRQLFCALQTGWGWVI